MKYEAKEKSLKMEKLFADITYYKLRAGKHFAYYIIGQGVEGYRVGGAHEVLNQALMLPRVRCVREAMGKKLKIVTIMGLCSSQRHGGTMMNAMKGDLPDMIRDVIQMNHQNSAPSIDKSHRVIRG